MNEPKRNTLNRATGSRTGGDYRKLIRNLRKGMESGEFRFCKRCRVHYHAHNAEHHEQCENDKD